MIANNPEFTTAVALLLQGHENCALKPEVKPEPKVVKQPIVIEEPQPEIPKPEPVSFVTPDENKEKDAEKTASQKTTEKADEENKGKGKGKGIRDIWDKWGRDLFNGGDI